MKDYTAYVTVPVGLSSSFGGDIQGPSSYDGFGITCRVGTGIVDVIWFCVGGAALRMARITNGTVTSVRYCTVNVN